MKGRRLTLYRNYDAEFFGEIDKLSSACILDNVIRLRAAVQYSNHNFSHQMRRSEAKLKFTDAPKEFARLDEDADHVFVLAAEYKNRPDQTKMNYSEARQWVDNITACSSGRESPGSFNTSVMSQIFQELSLRWEPLAEHHVELVADICLRFVRQVVSKLACPDVYDNMKAFLTEKMEVRKNSALAELKNLVRDQKKHLITYDHLYTDLVQEMRMNRQSAGFEARDKSPATDALICAIAYYKVDRSKASPRAPSLTPIYRSSWDISLGYFVDAVTSQVIERNLLQDLDGKILSAVVVEEMNEGNIAKYAADGDRIKQNRRTLNDNLRILKEGQDVFKAAE